METRTLKTYLDLSVVELKVEYTYYPEYKSNDRDVPNEEESITIDRVVWNGVDIRRALTEEQLNSISEDIWENIDDLKEASKDE